MKQGKIVKEWRTAELISEETLHLPVQEEVMVVQKEAMEEV